MSNQNPFSKLITLPPPGSGEYKFPLVLVMGLLFFGLGSLTILTIPYRFYLRSCLNDSITVPARIHKVTSGNRNSLSVRYEFRWRNEMITSNRATIFSESSGLYHRLVNAYESGDEILCHVDPQNPGLSAFEKDVNWLDVILMPLMGCPFAVIGFLYLRRYIGAHHRRAGSRYSK